jgi:hypothetical protein
MEPTDRKKFPLSPLFFPPPMDDRPQLAHLEAWVRQTVAVQGWPGAEVDRLLAQVSHVHSRDKHAFVHLIGKAYTGKTTLASKLVDVASDAQDTLVLRINNSVEWVKEIFRHACRYRKVGQARVDLSETKSVLYMPELKHPMGITAEQYGAMSRGEPVRLTWTGALIPDYIRVALTGVAGAQIYDAVAPNPGPPFVSAIFSLPRIVILLGNDLLKIDTTHLPAADAAALQAVHFETR